MIEKERTLAKKLRCGVFVQLVARAYQFCFDRRGFLSIAFTGEIREFLIY